MRGEPRTISPPMTTTFDALPGMETAVSEIARTLAEVWDMDAVPGKPAPSEFRASQMNLVVHLGLDNTANSARAIFDAALTFSHRYPCRTIVLCPRELGGGGDVRAKVFCECFIGASHHEMVCSEAIVLSYPLEQRAYIENQASILVESDLPLYYWPNRIQQASRFGDYRFFMSQAERIVFDSAVERAEVLEYPWPRPEVIRDLAHARMLPVRQSLGHFLSYVAPDQLVRGLAAMALHHGPDLAAESRLTAAWMRGRLFDCAKAAGLPAPGIDIPCIADLPPGGLDFRGSYSDGGTLRLAFDLVQGAACLHANLAHAKASISSNVLPLAPDRALAEALFF